MGDEHLGGKDGVSKIESSFEQALNRFPTHREEMFENLGEEMRSKVVQHIGQTVHDEHGNISDAQKPTVGSGKGYVAVHPVKKEGEGRGGNRPVTIFLNTGYFASNKHIKAKGDRPTHYVNGRLFYVRSKADAVNAANAAAKKLEEKLANDLR